MNLVRKFTERIPGTEAHVDARINKVFDDTNFDPEALTTHEAVVLEESVEEKYKPSLVASERTRYLGAVIGAIAPYEFLLIGAVTLAASAFSTTGAWYSITLKEMKEKFEGMGLSLTEKLLKADMIANSLSMYAGVGFAYREMVGSAVQDMVNDPNAVNAIRAAVSLVGAGAVHGALETILKNKEEASVQFDFNDATLAGMTEAQQKFFAQAVSDIQKELDGLDAQKPGVNFNRALLRSVNALIDMVETIDVEGIYRYKFAALDESSNELASDYNDEPKKFIAFLASTLMEVVNMLDFDEEQVEQFKKQLGSLTKENGGDQSVYNLASAVVADVLPQITGLVQDRGEKAIVGQEVAGKVDEATS
jgi:hypothetical protein